MTGDRPVPVREARADAGAPVSVLVIGVGNRFGSDDGFGPAVVDRFREIAPEIPAVETDGEATRLVETWDNADLVILVDAVRSGAPAGTEHRVVLDAGASAEDLGRTMIPTSSHAAGVADAWALGTVLDRTPTRLVVLGVEGARFCAGHQMSHEMARAVPRMVRAVQDEIAAARSQSEQPGVR
jgi:hydrogenase maturation protease